ncbi:hypothetical protein ES703_122732 [subsurface metagenome]
MFGYLLLRVHHQAGISRGISVSSLCVLDGGVLSRITSVAQKRLERVSDTTTSYLEGLILSKHTLVTSGEKSTIRLWLIFGGWVVAIDLPVTLLTTWLSHLLGVIVTLGIGCGKVSLKVGRFLRSFLRKWRGHSHTS